MTMTVAKTTLDVLRENPPGQVLLDVAAVAKAMGKVGPAAAQTIRNQISDGKFPLQDKIRRVGDKPMVPMVALAAWIDGDLPIVVDDKAVAKMRGRPRKALRDWVNALEWELTKLMHEEGDDIGSVTGLGFGPSRNPGI